MPSSDDYRSRNDLIFSEHNRCVCSLWRKGDRDVQLSACLDAGLDRTPLKSEGKGLGGCLQLIVHPLTLSSRKHLQRSFGYSEGLARNCADLLRRKIIYAARRIAEIGA